jgi:hypothetical protein
MAHGSDVRKELDKYGREGTGQKYKGILEARREMILEQRGKGIGGLIGSLNKNKDSKDN